MVFESLCFSRWVSFCQGRGDTIKNHIQLVGIWERNQYWNYLMNASLHVWLNSLNEVPSLNSQWDSGLTMSMLIILRSICKHSPDYRDWYRDGVYQKFLFFRNFIILWTYWKFSKYAILRVSEHYRLDCV